MIHELISHLELAYTAIEVMPSDNRLICESRIEAAKKAITESRAIAIILNNEIKNLKSCIEKIES